MNYTKSMIDLIKEIRRRVDAEVKPSIKMANPDLFLELQTIFHQSKDVVVHALIKELFQLAGDPWSDSLENNEGTERQILKTYRGQTELVNSSAPGQTPAKASTVAKRIYRGQVVQG